MSSASRQAEDSTAHGAMPSGAAKDALLKKHDDGPKFWLPKQLVNQLGYGGCAVIYTALWFFQARKATDSHARRLVWLLVMWDTHFIKRCLECLFVHKWSDHRNELFMGLGEWV